MGRHARTRARAHTHTHTHTTMRAHTERECGECGVDGDRQQRHVSFVQKRGIDGWLCLLMSKEGKRSRCIPEKGKYSVEFHHSCVSDFICFML